MATFAAVAGVPLPTKDREGAPMMFDSYDMTPALLKTGKSARDSWYYFTEDELSPGAIRLGKDLMKTYVKYPPRKAQSETYTGPITISKYQKFKWVREQLEKEGVSLPLPTGN